jgi:5-methylcytosine-specific restriction enzyme A
MRTGTRAWKQQRAKALQRDNHECQIRGPHCTVQATQVDHVVPVSQGGDDSLSNLVSTCATDHAAKTQLEALVGRNRQRRNNWKRQPERHPGLLP